MESFEVSFFGSSQWKKLEAKTMKEAKKTFARLEGVSDIGYIRARKHKGGSSYR